MIAVTLASPHMTVVTEKMPLSYAKVSFSKSIAMDVAGCVLETTVET